MNSSFIKHSLVVYLVFFSLLCVAQEKPGALLRKGMAAFDGKQFEEAVSFFSQAIALDSKYDTAYYKRANALSELKKYKEAHEDYTKAILLNAKYTNAYINRGNTKRRLGLDAESVTDYTKAIECDGKDADTYCKRAQARLKTASIKEALQDFDKAIEIEPCSFRAHNGKGGAFLISEKYDDALSEFNKAILCDSLNPTGYYDRALVEEHLEKISEAFADYTKAIWLNASDADAYNNRAVLYLDAREYDKAIADFEKAISLTPSENKYKKNLETALRKKKINFIPMQAKAPLTLKINNINHIIKGELISSCRMNKDDSLPRTDCYLEINEDGIIYSEVYYPAKRKNKPTEIKYDRYFLATGNIKARSKKSGITNFSCGGSSPRWLYYVDSSPGKVMLKQYLENFPSDSSPVFLHALRILFDSEKKAKEIENRLKGK